jgi:S-methylmethionine-dependent homocysteine/selenocysteine methylase
MSAVDKLNRRMDAGEIIVLDGGMGSELQANGVPMDAEAWSAVANLRHQDKVQEIHEDYIRAGADVIITNTFSAGRMALSAAGHEDRVVEANRRAVEAAIRARQSARDRAVVIAGSIAGFRRLSITKTEGRGRSEEQEHESFGEQASVLADAGVDVLALEMMNAPSYGLSALDAAFQTGLPVWLGVSAVRLSDGRLGALDPRRSREHWESFDDLLSELVRPDLAAVMLMHSKLEVVRPALELISRHWSGRVGVYPESGEFTPPNWVFAEVSPQAFYAEARAWVAQGAQLVGGCCGIRPAHIQALKQGLPSMPPTGRPLGVVHV